MATYTAKKIKFQQNGDTYVCDPISKLQKTDITALGIPGQDTTYEEATQSAAGLMSATDKTKLDGVATGATANVVSNSLSDTSTTNALSAAQGKALNDGKFPKVPNGWRYNEDIDALTSAGFYSIASCATGQTIFGIGNPWCLLIVYENDGFLYQTAYKDNFIPRTRQRSSNGTWNEWTRPIASTDIVNNLTSTATNVPLSAAKGKELKEMIENCKPIPIVLDTVTNTSGSYTHTTTVSGVTASMKPVLLEVGDTTVFRDKVTVSCSDGSITLTCADVVGTSTVTVSVMEQGSVPGGGQTVTSAEFDILNARIGTLASLTTIEKGSVVGAINEVNSGVSTLNSKIALLNCTTNNISDCNALTETGIYKTANATLNTPVTGFHYVIHHVKVSYDEAYQVAERIIGNRRWSRSYLNGSWSSWKNIINEDDVIDNLTSAYTNVPLSANMGRELNSKITWQHLGDIESTNDSVTIPDGLSEIIIQQEIDYVNRYGVLLLNSVSTAYHATPISCYTKDTTFYQALNTLKLNQYAKVYDKDGNEMQTYLLSIYAR